MEPTTIYLPIDIDSGPYCPHGCIGNWNRKSTCAVFWQDSSKARDQQGRPLRNLSGYVYRKCADCAEMVGKSTQVIPDARKTITVKWRPPPDIFKTE